MDRQDVPFVNRQPKRPDATMPTLDLIAQAFLERSHVPYSGRPEASVALLSDGAWVAGVRVENASFSLSIDASVNAVTAAIACGRTDIVAVYSTGPIRSSYLEGVLGDRWTDEDGLARRMGATVADPTGELDPFLHLDSDGVMETTRGLAKRAVVTQSDFPVSCVLETGDGRGIPGVNVEHPDWAGILCAERNALGTWITQGCPPLVGLHLSCLKDDNGTPCGACRQWLVELMSGVPVHMDRGDDRTEDARPADLLPGAFTGLSLRPGGKR